MYRIIERDSGRVLAYQDEPYYVHIGKNGCWDKCAAEEAEALSIRGTRYSLEGTPPTTWEVVDPGYDPDDPESIPTFHEEDAPVVLVRKCEAGEISFEQRGQIAEHAEQITDLEGGALELGDAVGEATTAALELADAIGTTAQENEAALLELGDLIGDMQERIAALETAQ